MKMQKVPKDWKVMIRYYRPDSRYPNEGYHRYYRNNRVHWTPGTHGGYCLVTFYKRILDDSGNDVSEVQVTGFSECSKHDQWVYKIGRELAFNRAVAYLEELGLAED